jgi:hypothetical protein
VRLYHGVIGLCVLSSACAPTRAGTGSLSPAPSLPPELERAVHVAALRSARFFLNLPTPFCIALERAPARRDPEPELLRALELQPPAVPMSRCPPTYGSWIQMVDSAGHPVGPKAPPGYIDPYHLAVSAAVPIVRNLVAVRIDATQGTGFWILYCEAVPKPPVQASCGVTMRGYS